MIGLNKIGLNQVQLNQLYLNTLCACQKSSGGDGFPRLPGDVTRWSFKGLTNEMMSKNPRLEDADHKGRFLTFKNFAWGGMSGCGGYLPSKEIFSYTPAVYSLNFTDPDKGIKEFDVYFQLIGLDENSGVSFNLDIRESGTAKRIKRETYTKDGIYHFEYKSEDDATNLYMIGYNGDGGGRTTFTVKILPYYAGALVFDGVDDYGICENFPILTKEKGYTVVALRKWLTPENKTNNEVLVANLKEPRWITENWGAFGCEVKYNNVNPKVKRTMSFGNTPVINVNENNVLLCQTSNNYNGVDIVSGNNTSGPYLLICSGGTSFFAKAAIWEIVILDHDATEEELTKIKNYFIKTYPWLFFDQAWTVVGKSNEDEYRATITNITGNGNDLVLSNFGFAEGSGYNEEGEYAGYLVTDGVDDRIISSKFTLGKKFTVVGEWELLDKGTVLAGFVKSVDFYLYPHTNGLSFFCKRGSNATLFNNIKSLVAFNSEGVAYDHGWQKYVDTKVGDANPNHSNMTIGTGNNTFAKVAFKNMAIYAEKVLSKEDMIKAYIYLQTLKAK